MDGAVRSPFLRYGLALALVTLALVVTLALEPVLSRTPVALFYVAVMLSAWYGGLRPGLIATALSAILCSYFFLPPANSLAMGLNGLIQLCLFLMVALLISSLLTAQSRAAKTLRASETRYRTIIEQSPMSIQILSPDGRTMQVNRTWEKLWGVTLDQIGGYNILEDQQLEMKGVMPYIKQAFAGQAAMVPPILYDPEETIPDLTIHEDSRRWVRAVIYPLKDESGNVQEVVLMHDDITEQKHAEEALRFQSHLLNTVEQAVIATDLNGRVTYWNQFAEKLYGYSAAEVMGRNILELTPMEESQEQAAEIMERLKKGESWSGEFHLRRRDNTAFPAQVTDTPIFDEKGALVGIVGVSVDITARKQAEAERAELAAQVELERQRLSSIVASVPGVVWEAWGQPDAKSQRINFVSDYVKKMLGYTVEEWLETPNFWLSIVHPEDRERAARLAAETFGGHQSVPNQFRWLTKDGRVLWVEAQSVAVYDDEGQPVGMRGVTMDITERKRIEEERASILAREQEARHKAEEANRIKDEFLATLSHELRTPLTAMLGWTRILRTRRLDEQTTTHALEIIERNATTQAQLIEDLLDVSRIITGNLRLDINQVTLPPVIQAAIDAIRPAADAKSLQVEIKLDPQAGPVSGDPARLQQVIWNLLINAVKFTPQGGRLEVLLNRVNSHVEIKVKDTGQGINPEFLPFVFDRFRQADSSTTRAHGGLGLGLAIVRHLVELHGGEVRAESAGPGCGATFTVSLPCLPVISAELSQAEDGAAQAQHCGALEGVSVLVVDDEPDTRDLLKTVLEPHGMRVTTAATTEDAIKVFEHSRPDLLISDIGMPDEDGYELIRKVRSLEAESGGEIPAAALTAYAGDEARQKTLSAGFQVHVAKPVDPGELISVVLRLVQSVRQSSRFEP